MSTTEEIDSRTAPLPAGDDVQYEFMSARALRGTEARTIAKWEKDGWELDTRTQGTLRTDLTFRRAKPKNPWQQCVAFLAAHWPAFGRLTSTAQHVALAAAGAVVALVLVGAIVAASVLGGGTAQPAAAPTEAATGEQQSGATTAVTPEPDAYTYAGPQYEVVVIDQNVGPAALTRYWVQTGAVDYSTAAYKDQVKLIVEDIAHQNGTAALMVDVVTDREVAESEAASTYEAFVAQRGTEYALGAALAKQEAHWVASYTGGFDYDTGQASQSAAAFEILWRPAATQELEQWQPALVG